MSKNPPTYTYTAIKMICLVLLLSFSIFAIPLTQTAVASEITSIETVIDYTNAMKVSLDSDQLDQATSTFAMIKKWWNVNKKDVKLQSLDMSLEIDGHIAAISLTLLTGEKQQAVDQLDSLLFSLKNYADGAYIDNDGNQNMTLSTYIMKIRELTDMVERDQLEEAQLTIRHLQAQWLSVEGDVVSQSQIVYTLTERNLVLVDAYLNNADQRSEVLPLLEEMIQQLTPLMNAHYSWLDAAFIPLREGLEALLVVGTLLMYAKKAESRNAQRWIIGGSSIGLLVSIVIGFLVAFWISTASFGNNNSLINGWTGVLASLLLLYVSYWLHRNSDVKRYNQMLHSKSHSAISNGKMLSLALLTFFAIVREGLETVIFLIGMAGKMSIVELIGGILFGFAVLILIAFIMIKFGGKLPLRPIFLISSLIVFYMCFKFMGSGIHSLQMAGLIPSTVHQYLPELNIISLYPSWYSTLPQLLFVLLALSVLLLQRISYRKSSRKNIILN
ncbi:FTR1 family iron permease [Paenibacillus endoradicis]|uniref:FTR1 family iron permease n=1 Tax=Paenibacillus endoradicis TaxID=2972487 RepID=UPI002158D72C|nr:FTR1 family protein [Paenibacillus endoradicis]MCR8657595.1 FTR1 family iron permease [Paenibacillus endoradicis]